MSAFLCLKTSRNSGQISHSRMTTYVCKILPRFRINVACMYAEFLQEFSENLYDFIS